MDIETMQSHIPLSFSILREVTEAEAVTELINSAYLCESFFRNPDCIERVSLNTVQDVIANREGRFQAYIVGRPTEDVIANDKSVIPAGTPVCCVFLEWEIEFPDHGTILKSSSEIERTLAKGFNVQSLITMHVIGHLGQLSCLPKIQGRGLGRRTLEHAENMLRKQGPILSIVTEGVKYSISTTMKLHVLSVRTDVLPWYPRMGYSITKVGEIFDDPIVSPEYHNKITIIEMEKKL